MKTQITRKFLGGGDSYKLTLSAGLRKEAA